MKAALTNVPVLVVDDNASNRIVLEGQLVSLGYSVRTVNDGQAAVDAFKGQKFALVLMDCEMPVLDGFASAKAIRKLESENNLTPIPILAVTGHTSDDIKILAKHAGMNELINKPIATEVLGQILQNWLVS